MFTLDSGVLLEYITVTSPNYSKVRKLLKYKLYLPLTSLTEAYYISVKLYKAMRVEDPEVEAEKLFKFFLNHPNLEVVTPNSEIALKAGKIKEKYRVSLADSYVIATAETTSTKPLFRKIERELADKYWELKQKYNLTVLSELKI